VGAEDSPEGVRRQRLVLSGAHPRPGLVAEPGALELPKQAAQPAARTPASAEHLTEDVAQAATSTAAALATAHHLAEDVTQPARGTRIPAAAAGGRTSVGEHRQDNGQQGKQCGIGAARATLG